MKHNFFSSYLSSRTWVMSGMLLLGGSAFAQSKWSNMSRVQIKSMQEQVAESANAKGIGNGKAKVSEPILKAIVNMKPGHTVSELADRGFKVSVDLGNMGVVHLKLSDVEKVDSIEGIQSISLGQKARKRLDKANEDTGVDKIHEGEGLNMPYTGKDVVVAVLDGGFDPNHPMFLDKDGKTRVTCMMTLNATGEGWDVITDPEELAHYTTDDVGEIHGSHVAGIAAGKVRVGTDADKFPYNGVATDAQIAMVVSSRESDVVFIEALQQLVNLYPGKRIVVNMSLGMNTGPHDGKSNFEIMLDEFLEKHPNMVFCICAGNEGDKDIVQRHTFEGQEDTMDGGVSANVVGEEPSEESTHDAKEGAVSNATFNGQFDIWANDEEPFEIELSLSKGEETLWKSGKINFSGDVKVFYKTTEEGKPGYDPNLAEVMDGEACVDVRGGVFPNNNRFNAAIRLSGNVKNVDDDTYWNYKIFAKDGKTVTVYVEDGTSLLALSDITQDGTINGYATGKQVIQVGAYVTKNRFTTYSEDGTSKKEDYSSEYTIGDVAYFSSWGRLEDGRQLPLICAPGVFVVSAVNSYSPETGGYVVRREYKGREYDWMAFPGTSMSTPYMTGVVALWLEANPKLTRDQIVEIATETAHHDIRDTEDEDKKVQWGAGKVDAYAGLKKALDLATAILVPINQEKNIMMREVAPRTYEAYVAGANHVSAAVYTLDGQLVSSSDVADHTVRVSVPSVPAGVYLFKVASGTEQTVRKILVK